VQAAQEKKNEALGILNSINMSVVPSLLDPDKSNILGEVGTLTGQATAITVPSVESSRKAVSESREKVRTASAAVQQARQKLAGLESGTSACDGLGPTQEISREAMGAADEAQRGLQDIRRLVARVADCKGTLEARDDSGGRQGDRSGEGQGGGTDIGDRFRRREGDRDRTVKDFRDSQNVYTGSGGTGDQSSGGTGGSSDGRAGHGGGRGEGSGSGGGGGTGGSCGPGGCGSSGSGSGGGKPTKGPQTAGFKCKSNADCWSHFGSDGYFCNKGSGKCIKCPPGQHGKKDGTPACHSE
jgi:hypothetical protein